MKQEIFKNKKTIYCQDFLLCLALSVFCINSWTNCSISISQGRGQKRSHQNNLVSTLKRWMYLLKCTLCTPTTFIIRNELKLLPPVTAIINYKLLILPLGSNRYLLSARISTQVVAEIFSLIIKSSAELKTVFKI